MYGKLLINNILQRTHKATKWGEQLIQCLRRDQGWFKLDYSQGWCKLEIMVRLVQVTHTATLCITCLSGCKGANAWLKDLLGDDKD